VYKYELITVCCRVNKEVIRISTHTGTHIETPLHYNLDQYHYEVAEIPMDKLFHVPLVVIDVSTPKGGRLVDIKEIQEWEKKYGRIPENAFLLFKSGAWRI